ncbi:ABC transporter substrate-binding protein [Erwinia psidii]|uniref:Iron ABC transporter substrate-binding protein n=1 Tax=Erwinia psidii TaxID=69224 RepID=A0A3N6SG75_9GAMM|nr:ABC transporter substrate-binding protein [Erwinia psidii]MCX8958382.1 iron ABC transporter substrate-binding protein [Erwinia psidii]MCX8961106.1 iron ABC transporter substrate-binding protein [Erwinia psidii]MCX8965465.1 iron ABC transporter substrate-binding protein [Erwinia psidii]RQM38903.1 iron ABC transporter substrate-binding protein [Erwinia psidii]
MNNQQKMIRALSGKRIARGLAGLMLGLISFATPAVTVTDVAGRTVTVPDNVQRILLGEGRLFYAISLLEGQKPLDRIVGWQGDFRMFDAQTYAIYQAKFPQIDNIPLIGKGSADSISPEKVLTLNPQLAVFGLSGHGPGKNSELVNQLQKAGVPVVFVDFRTSPLKNTLPSMELLGKVLNREQQAQDYIRFWQEQIKRVTDVTKNIPEQDKLKVFIELRATTTVECCHSAGNGNMGDFIELAGGVNIARPLLPGPLGLVNLEKVIAEQPDIYLLSGGSKPPKAGDPAPSGLVLGAQTTPEQARASLTPLLARKGIKTLDAIKNGRTVGIWHNFYNSPYNVLAVQVFARSFYPQQFADLDPQQTQQQLYKQFLAIEPSGTYWTE